MRKSVHFTEKMECEKLVKESSTLTTYAEETLSKNDEIRNNSKTIVDENNRTQSDLFVQNENYGELMDTAVSLESDTSINKTELPTISQVNINIWDKKRLHRYFLIQAD